MINNHNYSKTFSTCYNFKIFIDIPYTICWIICISFIIIMNNVIKDTVSLIYNQLYTVLIYKNGNS